MNPPAAAAAGLTPSDVVAVWEAGRDADPIARAGALWRAATGASDDALARTSVGRVDAALIRSRIATFGSSAASFVECPQCGEELEFDLDLEQLLVDAQDVPGPQVVERDGWRIEFRLPGMADVRAVAADGGGRRGLLERCIVAATRQGSAEPPARAAADDALAAALDDRMRRLDPQADLELRPGCAACGHAWRVRFDIGHFFWREIEVEATRLLGEVHQLARAYAWSESDILALSPVRRRAYVSMAAGGSR